MKRPRPLLPRIVHDSRRDSWIIVVPPAHFLGEPLPGDTRAAGRSLRRLVWRRAAEECKPLGAGERAIPWIMLAWSFVVWTFLFYDLGHL